MSVDDSSDPIVTVHTPGDLAAAPCVGCGRMVALTRPVRAGDTVHHGACWNERNAA